MNQTLEQIEKELEELYLLYYGSQRIMNDSPYNYHPLEMEIVVRTRVQIKELEAKLKEAVAAEAFRSILGLDERYEIDYDYENRRITTRGYSKSYEEVREDMPPVTKKRRFENKTPGSNKFWEVTTNISSRTYEVRYGAIGNRGTSKRYGPLSSSQLRTEVDRKCNSKLNKGYVEIKSAEPKRKSRESAELSGEDLIYELDI